MILERPTVIGVLVMRLTKSRIEQVQRHAVAFFRTSNCDEPLIRVVLGFVDLDHTTADLADLIDLRATLADDSADHVVGDVDLLGH